MYFEKSCPKNKQLKTKHTIFNPAKGFEVQMGEVAQSTQKWKAKMHK